MANRPTGGTFIGLDIGTATIKVVEVKGMAGNIQVSSVGIADTPPGTIEQGMVKDSKALGAAVKALLTRSGIRGGKCVSAATGNAGVVVRVIEVPKMNAKDLAETMKWEIERHIPFAANDVEMGYQKIDDAQNDADPNSLNMEVLLAVAQRDMVAEHLSTLDAAGLQPFTIDVEPLAVGRALVDLDNSGLASRNVAIVNIGASNTEVGIYKNAILRFPRNVPIAGDNVTRNIADQLGISMDQAEGEKREYAAVLMDVLAAAEGAGGGTDPFGDNAFGSSPFDMSDLPPANPFETASDLPPANPFDAPATTGGANPFDAPPLANPFDAPPANPFDSAPANPFADGAAGASPFDAPETVTAPAVMDPRMKRQREIFDAIFPVLDELAVEVGRSVDFFRSRYPNERIDQVLLCGGSAQIVDLEKFFESKLGLPTRIANPFQSVRVTSKQMDPNTLDRIAPTFAVALGLAARDAVIGSDK